MINYNLQIECSSKEAIEAIKQYALTHFGVTIVESSKENTDTSHIGSRVHTVLRTTPRKKSSTGGFYSTQ